MLTLDQLLAEYDRWADEREIVSAKEASGNFPAAQEWHDSDDWAVELLHQLAAAVRGT
jgi:hypothetical protein